MRIAIITIGGRGDVQPYIALGVGLKQVGHLVTLVANTEFASLVQSYQLDFAPLNVNIQQAMRGQQGQRLNQAGQKTQVFLSELTALLHPLFVQGTREAWPACAAADLIISSTSGFFMGFACAEKLQRPFCLAHVYPATPTTAYPHSLYTGQVPLGGLGNWLSYWVLDVMVWQLMRKSFNLARQEALGLPPLPWHWAFLAAGKLRYPILYGYSPSLLPKPREWGDWIHVTGYWFLNEPPAWTPPPALVEFLRAGPPPVYVGFGSMNDENPAALSQMIVDMLVATGQRGVLGMGWGQLGQNLHLPASVFVLESAPHSWLFPQMAAVVHHGGAGTTGAGLRAGKPTVVVPFMADQFFWGRTLHQKGLAPPPVLRTQLTATRLATVITQATQDVKLAQRTTALGERIRAEDGATQAAMLINKLFT